MVCPDCFTKLEYDQACPYCGHSDLVSVTLESTPSPDVHPVYTEADVIIAHGMGITLS